MLLFDYKVTKNKWKYQHLCSVISALRFCNLSTYAVGLRPPPGQIASAVQSDCVRRPIGLRSVYDEKVWGGIHQKGYFYSLFPIHLGSTTVPITRNG